MYILEKTKKCTVEEEKYELKVVQCFPHMSHAPLPQTRNPCSAATWNSFSCPVTIAWLTYHTIFLFTYIACCLLSNCLSSSCLGLLLFPLICWLPWMPVTHAVHLGRPGPQSDPFTATVCTHTQRLRLSLIQVLQPVSLLSYKWPHFLCTLRKPSSEIGCSLLDYLATSTCKCVCKCPCACVSLLRVPASLTATFSPAASFNFRGSGVA